MILRCLFIGLCVSMSASAHIPAYQRADWTHWTDADGDCQTTRDEALIAQSATPVTFRDARQCRVRTGQWRDPYSGFTYTQSDELDIDHVVPLKWAHEHGGWSWSSARKAQFANSLDADHLLVVHRSLNRAKGAKGPDLWQPRDRHDACHYGRAWKDITARWALALTWNEMAAIDGLLTKCAT